jgi:acetyl-CoA hydrolase
MMLSDLGAEVTVIEAPHPDAGRPRPEDICNRGKQSVTLDLHQPDGLETLLKLVEQADVLIEGVGPGAAEKLGFGPDACHLRCPSLVYGRASGWGQTGPLANQPGRDGNHTAISGALWMATAPDQCPAPTGGVLGVAGGGALYLAIGVIAGVLHARESGHGQVVDAAAVEGSAHLLNLSVVMLPGRGSFFNLKPASNESFVMRSYRCSDGEWINLSAIEPKFYSAFLEKLGLDGDEDFLNGFRDKKAWKDLAARLETTFASKTRGAWCELLEGTDACFAPVLTPRDAAGHPHNVARELYVTVDGILQVAATPRFSATPSAPPARVPARGEHTEQVLMSLRTMR